MEVVDETIDPADPRFRVYYPAAQRYLPGYWATAENAKAGAAHLCQACGDNNAGHKTVDGVMCSGCLSQCVD